MKNLYVFEVRVPAAKVDDVPCEAIHELMAAAAKEVSWKIFELWRLTHTFTDGMVNLVSHEQRARESRGE